jgi:aspartyl-tRNA(Asn)/glutamyl-tRNA(Gln) amidotransferase subunit A
MYLSDSYTLPASLAGIPAISVPVAPTKSGLPIGLQIMAPFFAEEIALKLGAAVEARFGGPDRMPSMARV